jgi:hypothetical protein
MVRLVICLLLLAGRAAAQRTAIQSVHSGALPRIQVQVDTSFGYLGHAQFAVGDAARAEQFVFGDVRDGYLARAVVVHFESFHPGNDSRFVYPAAPADTLAGAAYLHQHWWLGPDFFDRPGVRSLLARRGVVPDSAYVADRHVRAVDSRGKHEIIIFYLEGASTFDQPPGRTVPGIAGNVPPAVARGMAERARKAFRVIPE